MPLGLKRDHSYVWFPSSDNSTNISPADWDLHWPIKALYKQSLQEKSVSSSHDKTVPCARDQCRFRHYVKPRVHSEIRTNFLQNYVAFLIQKLFSRWRILWILSMSKPLRNHQPISFFFIKNWHLILRLLPQMNTLEPRLKHSNTGFCSGICKEGLADGIVSSATNTCFILTYFCYLISLFCHVDPESTLNTLPSSNNLSFLC